MAVIGFAPHIYHVSEGIDRLANLTVKLISGQLGWEVVTFLNTESGSATSIYHYQYCMHILYRSSYLATPTGGWISQLSVF